MIQTQNWRSRVTRPKERDRSQARSRKDQARKEDQAVIHQIMTMGTMERSPKREKTLLWTPTTKKPISRSLGFGFFVLIGRFTPDFLAAQAGDVIDLDTNEVVKSDGKRKISKKDKDEFFRREREQMK